MKSRRRIAQHLQSNELPSNVARDLRGILLNNKEVLPGWTPSFLRRLGPIDTVIDVGVLRGTPALYAAFPNAYLVLVEPLPPYKEHCERILANRRGEIHMTAAGSTEGMTTIRYYKDVPARSSILDTAKANDLEHTKLEVSVKRLDTIIADSPIHGDILLKVDVEGMEYEVIQGAQQSLPRMKYVITETSIKRRHKNSYRFADLIRLMAESGFDLYDVLTVTRAKAMRPKASIMDAIFINSVVI